MTRFERAPLQTQQLIETLVLDPACCGGEWPPTDISSAVYLYDKHVARLTRSCIAATGAGQLATDLNLGEPLSRAVAAAVNVSFPLPLRADQVLRIRVVVPLDALDRMEATPVVIPRPWGLGRPFPVNIATNEWCEPTLLKLDPVPVDYSAWSAPFGIVHKTPDRAVYEAAAARVASPDALLHSRAGHVLESCIANIAVHDRAAGVWITPGADPALGEWLLPGCYRAHAIEHGWIREGSVAVESVLAPDALVLAFNSVRGWWPVRVVVSSS